MKKYLLALILVLLFTGCTSGGSPVSPDPIDRPQHQANQASAPHLWGLWNVELDPDSGRLDLIPLRSAGGIWNVTQFLQPPAGSFENLGIEILDKSNFITQGRMDLRVTLHHPFPSPKLRGFDIRGVVMSDGITVDPYNNDIIYPSPDELRLLNADGYTRWMNASEFTVPGVLGYTPGGLGTNMFVPTSTINGYKYFPEIMTPEQSVFEYFSESLAYVANRGSLTPGLEVSRDYHLKFPTSPLQVKFQYAIISGWEKATSGGGNPSPLDFPDNANTFEPIGLSVVDSSTLFMESPLKSGGDISLKLNIVDWWAYWDPDNLSDHISKIVVSSNSIDFIDPVPADYIEFDFSFLDHYPTSAGNSESVEIFIPNVKPSGVDKQEVLIAIEMSGYDYSNPFGVPNGAGTDPLTAYFMHTFDVSPEFNDPPIITSGINGDTSVFINETIIYSVTATDEDTPVLDYYWTIEDPLNGDVLFGPDPGNGDGDLEIDWGVVYTPGDVVFRCTVSDGENEVDANPLDVTVGDIIFRADLNDITTGDNAGWTSVEEQGTSWWTSDVGEDNVLQGYGYKFGFFNTVYTNESAGILITPQISIPDTIDRAVAIIFHCYEWEYYAPLEVGFDGGNFKITEAPTTPVYDDPEIDIIGGYDYEGWLFDTAISSQMVFFSDKYSDELVVSAIEIPTNLLGSDIYLGFACASDDTTMGDYHGWLIDDVQIRALPDGANAPPIAGTGVTGDEILPLLPGYPGHYRVLGYDLEDDPLSYAWTARVPDSGEILWGPETIDDSNEVTIDWSSIGSTGELEVHVSIYDGTHPGVAAQPLTVMIQEVVFHADFSDTTTGDNAGWTTVLGSGTTLWTNDVGEDGFLKGFGYKWGDFDTSYTENSQGILMSPSIGVPTGISMASLYVRHDYEFLATLDGGNFKVTKAPIIPDFATSAQTIDGGWDYDVKLNGTVMDNQWSFGVGGISDNGLVSRMDLATSTFGSSVYFGAAAASGDVMFNQRGWMIDDVVLAVSPD